MILLTILHHLLILCNIRVPLKWEVDNDAYGERKPHPNYDWERRCVWFTVIAIIMMLFDVFLLHRGNNEHFSFLIALLLFIKYFLSAFCFFTAIFDYWVNYVHLKNRVTVYKNKRIFPFLTGKEVVDHVLTHLSDTAWPDRLRVWRALGKYGRLTVKVLLMVVAVWLWVL